MRNIFSNYNKTVLCSLFYKSYSINSDENSKTKKYEHNYKHRYEISLF